MNKKSFPEKLRSLFGNVSADLRNKIFMLFSAAVLIALFLAILFGLIVKEPLYATLSALAGAVFFAAFLYFSVRMGRIREAKIRNMLGESRRMHRLFDQTAAAFVQAVEKKDEFTRGHAFRVAEYARKVAEMAGKSEEDCEKVYYTALLHDVGLIGIPDQVIQKDSFPGEWEREMMRQKPVIGSEILSNITEYPYLSQGARFCHERYNGSGYPQGLKGEEIPEIARIVAVADAYVTMTTRKRYRDPAPDFVAREAFVKGAGEEFDPVFADLMVRIIDKESKTKRRDDAEQLESTIVCREYRDQVSGGVPLDMNIRKITFDCTMPLDESSAFSAPSVLLFNSFDGRVHAGEKAIAGYHYHEYGEIWFDRQPCITTEARRIRERFLSEAPEEGESTRYEVSACRYEDHLRLILKGKGIEKEVIVALPGGLANVFLALTGENCRLDEIAVSAAGETVSEGDIERIADRVSYLDHLESDLPNVQIDRKRSASTKGVPIGRRLKLSFHSQGISEAELVWHCPYVVLYSAEDGEVNGTNYREYALIKLNGEIEETEEAAKNRFVMKRTEAFFGWDVWKEKNKTGVEWEVSFERLRNGQIRLKTENMGIAIENTTTFSEHPSSVYAALTGDQVALTDIRISEH